VRTDVQNQWKDGEFARISSESRAGMRRMARSEVAAAPTFCAPQYGFTSSADRHPQDDWRSQSGKRIAVWDS
jgi:hypothetical protein